MRLIIGDAFGLEIYAAFMGNPQAEIIEREDGLISARSHTQDYLDPFPLWHVTDRKAMRFARGRVLDVGCGGGRHSLYLQEKGLDVVGIDNSSLAVEVCKRRGLKNVKLMSLAQVNHNLGKFDTVLMMGNNFGLMENRDRAKILFKKFFRLTTSQGRIIAQTADPYNTQNPDHLSYHKSNLTRGRMAGQVKIRVRYNRIASPWFDYLLVSKSELEELVSGTGWRVARYLEATDSPVYVAIIEKT